MRILYLTDRLSVRGGADLHLRRVMAAMVEAGHEVMLAFGRGEADATLPEGVSGTRVRGLSATVAGRARLGSLASLVERAEVVHVQNVMNPSALEVAVESSRAVVTVQDHRVFCPGPGKTLPDGSPCRHVMGEAVCTACLPDLDYRRRTLALTQARLAAILRARVVVLSRYMARELEAIGCPGAVVIPPWVETFEHPIEPGSGFVIGGRLVGHKGVLDAWEAWRAAATDQPLLVAGAGPLAERLDGCQRLGWLPPDRLRAVLRGARALLFPPRWQEPFGILGVEALAEGTAVVVAASGGSDEWSDVGSLVVRAGDVAAMARAIVRLARDPDLAVRLGSEGRAMVTSRFARSRLEPCLRAAYAEACARGGP